MPTPEDGAESQKGNRRASPRTEPSDEVESKGLDMARAQGDALERTVRYLLERADDGGEIRAGDFRVACAVESAEGLHYLRPGGRLEWEEPKDENCHIAVLVRDATDGRFVPGLSVRVTVIGPDGREVGTHDHPFLWHPWLHRYGRNWKVPTGGAYALRVHIDPPTFPRHDHENGARYREPVDVEFAGVKIEAGRGER